jgi:hypothetical protein
MADNEPLRITIGGPGNIDTTDPLNAAPTNIPEGLKPVDEPKVPQGLSPVPDETAVTPAGLSPVPSDMPAPPHNDPVADRLHDSTTPVGKLMDAIGQGAKYGWGGNVGPSEEFMRSIGLGIDTNRADWWNPIKAVNETIIRPLAQSALTTLDVASRVPQAAIGGAAGFGAFIRNPDASEKDIGNDAENATDSANDYLSHSPFFADAPLAMGVTEAGIPRRALPGTAAKIDTAEVRGVASQEAVEASQPPARAMAEEFRGPASASAPIPDETPMIDKAGNLNLNYINTPEDVKNVLRATAAKAGQFMQERGMFGDTSNAKTFSDAQDILANATHDVTTGIPDFMAHLQYGDNFDRATSAASRMWIEQAASETAKLAKVATQSGKSEDMVNFVTAEQRTRLAMGIDNQSAAEVARIQQARQIKVGEGGEFDPDMTAAIKELDERNGLSPEERAKILSTLDTPQQVAQFLNDSRKANWKDMMLEYVVNNFLSGPITHTYYTVSGILATGLRIGETAVASQIGKLRGSQMDAAEFSALNDERAGLMDRFNEANSTQGRPLTAIEAQTMHDRMAEIQQTLKDKTPVMPGEAAARFFGALKGSKDGIKAAWAALKSGEAGLLPGEKPYVPGEGGSPPTFVRNSIPGPLGTVIRIPTRVIGGIHTFQKVMGYTESMNALAYRQAASEGLEGDALTARVTGILSQPSSEMMEAARDEAKYASLMGEPGKFGQAVENLANVNHGTKLVITFARVTNNILSQGLLERTPIGLLSPTIRADLAGESGLAKQNTAIARMAVGSSIGLGVAGLAIAGHATGAAPSDPAQRNFDHDLLGRPAYSVQIGNWWIADRHLGPVGPIIATGANLAAAAKVAVDRDLLDGASYFATAMGKYALEESPMDGLHNTMEAIDDSDRKGPTFMHQALTSMFVPFSSAQSQIAHAVDPNLRQTNTLLETWASKTPFIGQDVPPKIDVFGQPVMSGQNMGAQYAQDPVVSEMKALSLFPGLPLKTAFGVKLTEEQYNKYAALAGSTFHLMASNAVGDEKWNTYTPYQRYTMLDKLLVASREQARAALALEYLGPEGIIAQSAQQKQNIVNGVVPPNPRMRK